MTTDNLTKFAKPAYLMLLLLVAVVGWSVRMEARLGEVEKAKADRAELQAIQNTLERVDDRTARIERYICRGEVQQGLGC